jgi:hypothetical protein
MNQNFAIAIGIQLKAVSRKLVLLTTYNLLLTVFGLKKQI